MRGFFFAQFVLIHDSNLGGIAFVWPLETSFTSFVFFDASTTTPTRFRAAFAFLFILVFFRTLFVSFPALCSISHMFSRRPYWSSWKLGRIAGTFCAAFKFRFSTRFSFPLFAFLFPVLLPSYIVPFPCLLLSVYSFSHPYDFCGGCERTVTYFLLYPFVPPEDWGQVTFLSECFF